MLEIFNEFVGNVLEFSYALDPAFHFHSMNLILHLSGEPDEERLKLISLLASTQFFRGNDLCFYQGESLFISVPRPHLPCWLRSVVSVSPFRRMTRLARAFSHKLLTICDASIKFVSI